MSKREKKKRLRARDVLLGAAVVAITSSAVVEQLRRPHAERTWHGDIIGVPYDFRLPTVERMRATFWNKDESRIIVPQVFGVGWTINAYPLIHPRPVQRLP